MKYDETESREDKIKRIPLYHPDKKSWPNYIREIATTETNSLAIDVRGRLYWDGKLIEITRLTLSFWQKIAGFVFVLSAFVGALIPAWAWGCKLEWVNLCPIPQP